MTDELVDAHMLTSAARSARAADTVARVGKVSGWASEEFVSEAVETVLAAQSEQASATWSYLEQFVQEMDPYDRLLGIDPPVDKLIGSATRDGAPLETVYRRPGKTAADLAVSGLSPEFVNERVESQVREMVTTDVSTAGRNAEQAYGAVDDRVIGWQRVPEPGACAYCRYIATQIYSVEEMAPAHKFCNCGTRAVTADIADGVDVENREALRQIRAEGVPKVYRKRDRPLSDADEEVNE